MYSINWNPVNIVPNKIVAPKLQVAVQFTPFKILRWHNEIVMPDDNKIIVFNKGYPQGLNACIPTGGQLFATNTDGFKLE